MTYEFKSIDEIIFSFEKDLINSLFEYGLLQKFDLNVRKLFLYMFLIRINNELTNNKLLIHHNGILDSNHELLTIYPVEEVNHFINKSCKLLKKITGRLFFIQKHIKVPQKQYLSELNGDILDIVLLLQQNQPNLKQLKKLLKNFNLSDIYQSLSKNIV